MDGPHYLTRSTPGIYVDNARYTGLRDGDTPEFLLPVLGKAAIRLTDIDCPEKTTEVGRLATIFTDELCRNGGDYQPQIYLELPEDRDGDGRVTLIEILKEASWDRWPGTIFIGSRDIRQLLIDQGYATWKPYRK